MPGGDKTGPFGAGPMTGRGAGYCAGFTQPGFANPYVPGRRGGMGGGFGRGRGFGRGFGWGRAAHGWPAGGGYAGAYGGYPATFGAVASGDQEQEALKQQAQYLQQSLDAISKRIAELEEQK